jgi:hypothetical protein
LIPQACHAVVVDADDGIRLVLTIGDATALASDLLSATGGDLGATP